MLFPAVVSSGPVLTYGWHLLMFSPPSPIPCSLTVFTVFLKPTPSLSPSPPSRSLPRAPVHRFHFGPESHHLCVIPLQRKNCSLDNLSDSFVFLPNTPGAFRVNRIFDRYVLLCSPKEEKPLHSMLHFYYKADKASVTRSCSLLSLVFASWS